eukprot:696131_1
MRATIHLSSSSKYAQMRFTFHKNTKYMEVINACERRIGEMDRLKQRKDEMKAKRKEEQRMKQRKEETMNEERESEETNEVSNENTLARETDVISENTLDDTSHSLESQDMALESKNVKSSDEKNGDDKAEYYFTYEVGGSTLYVKSSDEKNGDDKAEYYFTYEVGGSTLYV